MADGKIILPATTAIDALGEHRKEEKKRERPPHALLPVHDELTLTGWELVRHVPAGKKWFAAQDDLKGTERAYGDPLGGDLGGDHPRAQEWSLEWDDAVVEQYLFSTGDGTKFLVIESAELKRCREIKVDDGLVPTRVRISSASAAPGIVIMKHSPGKTRMGTRSRIESAADTEKVMTAEGQVKYDPAKDRSSFSSAPGVGQVNPAKDSLPFAAHVDGDEAYPFLSLTNFKEAKQGEGLGFLYGEGDFSLEPANSKTAGPKSAEGGGPEAYGLSNVEKCGGMNVYIRRRLVTNGLAVCINGLAGSPESPDSLLALKGDAMRLLWRVSPHVIFAGLAHAFYRADTMDWLASVIPYEMKHLKATIGTPLSVAEQELSGGALPGARVSNSNWAAAAVAVAHEVAALDVGSNVVAVGIAKGLRQPVRNAALIVRDALGAVSFRGWLLGPLRQSLKPIRQVGNAFSHENHGTDKWCAAVKAPDGRLFFLPKAEKRDRILVFDPRRGQHFFIKIKVESKTKNKTKKKGGGEWQYSSAVVGGDGCIYGIPAAAKGVLKISPQPGHDTTDKNVSILNLPELPPGSKKNDGLDVKWGQGALAANGKIYAAPFSSDVVLVIDPKSGTTKFEKLDVLEKKATMDNEASEGKRWWGAVATLTKGEGGTTDAVFFVPYNHSCILKLDTSDPSAAAEFGPPLSGGGPDVLGSIQEKYMEACLTKEGQIVAAPSGSGGRKVLIFDPNDTSSVKFAGRDCFDGAMLDKWHGMVTGADGCAYGIPYNESHVLKVDPTKAAAAFARAAVVEGDDVKARLKDILTGVQCGVNSVVFDPLLKEEHGLFGSAALADDGFIYAAPTRARFVTRIDSLRASDPHKRHIWHNHALGVSDLDSGWRCDGVEAPGGCRGSGGGTGTRYRCCKEACDFDLCKQCWEFGQKTVQTGSMHWLWRNDPEKWFRSLCNPSYRSDFIEWFQDHAEEKRAGTSLASQCGAGLRGGALSGDVDAASDAGVDDAGGSSQLRTEPIRPLTAADAPSLVSGTKLVFKKASTYG